MGNKMPPDTRIAAAILVELPNGTKLVKNGLAPIQPSLNLVFSQHGIKIFIILDSVYWFKLLSLLNSDLVCDNCLTEQHRVPITTRLQKFRHGFRKLLFTALVSENKIWPVCSSVPMYQRHGVFVSLCWGPGCVSKALRFSRVWPGTLGFGRWRIFLFF
jgi:hypothetical protein